MEWKGVLKIDLDRETVPDLRDPSSDKKYWKTFRYCAVVSCLLRILRCFGNLLSHIRFLLDDNPKFLTMVTGYLISFLITKLVFSEIIHFLNTITTNLSRNGLMTESSFSYFEYKNFCNNVSRMK